MRAIYRIVFGVFGAALLTALVLFVMFGLPDAPIELHDLGPLPVWIWLPASIALVIAALAFAGYCYRRIHPLCATPRTARQALVFGITAAVSGAVESTIRPFVHALSGVSERLLAVALLGSFYSIAYLIERKFAAPEHAAVE